MRPRCPLLFLNLTLYPVCNFLPLESPRSADLEARNLACRGELVGGLLIDLEKFRHLPDRQDFVGHTPAVTRGLRSV
jgi:hypothetical protein